MHEVLAGTPRAARLLDYGCDPAAEAMFLVLREYRCSLRCGCGRGCGQGAGESDVVWGMCEGESRAHASTTLPCIVHTSYPTLPSLPCPSAGNGVRGSPPPAPRGRGAPPPWPASCASTTPCLPRCSRRWGRCWSGAWCTLTLSATTASWSRCQVGRQTREGGWRGGARGGGGFVAWWDGRKAAMGVALHLLLIVLTNGAVRLLPSLSPQA